MSIRKSKMGIVRRGRRPDGYMDSGRGAEGRTVGGGEGKGEREKKTGDGRGVSGCECCARGRAPPRCPSAEAGGKGGQPCLPCPPLCEGPAQPNTGWFMRERRIGLRCWLTFPPPPPSSSTAARPPLPLLMLLRSFRRSSRSPATPALSRSD